MPTYDVERSCEELVFDTPFQDIERILGINVPGDARDPVDETSFVIPAGTPMAAVHAGTVHDLGLWMPIRRDVITNVDVDGVTLTGTDVSPFKVGDLVQTIGSTGPTTGAVTNLAGILTIDYTLQTMTFAATAGVVVGDWIEVIENGAVVGTVWQVPKLVGVLRDPIDMRVTPSDTTGTMTTAEVVTEGALEEGALNFPMLATTDLILVPELSLWNPSSGGVQIITRPHGAVAVVVPDMV